MSELLNQLEKISKGNALAKTIQTAVVVGGVVALASFGVDISIGA